MSKAERSRNIQGKGMWRREALEMNKDMERIEQVTIYTKGHQRMITGDKRREGVQQRERDREGKQHFENDNNVQPTFEKEKHLARRHGMEKLCKLDLGGAE
ncbi:hypothetical protein ElyMa_003058300 [Elysia marginata]|uniref:Uncharacterized protein n=1 Tax=Elysia marginata TaxID=1093978 RepID=A0AAV4IIP4_9GAST|nr:hypothetical protein ElyMa_003058300 [Elysia marginata]